MAYVIYRKSEDKSHKKDCIPKSRKYKTMFYVSLIINIALLSFIVFNNLL
jgi:hypothetical protein